MSSLLLLTAYKTTSLLTPKQGSIDEDHVSGRAVGTRQRYDDKAACHVTDLIVVNTC